MATTSRPENPDLSQTDAPPFTMEERFPIAKDLAREPYRFDFFQAVRLLCLMHPERRVPGRFTNPEDEVARFGAATSIAFPASQIQALDMKKEPATMQVNFMGLTGPLGVLPLDYSRTVIDRERARDTAMRDFFDLFNHRMLSLFYQAWEKYRFNLAYERGERDRLSNHVMALMGLGTPGLRDRQEVADDSLLFYSGVMSMHTRSATALRHVLMDYFGVPVNVEQFVGAWYAVERDAQCCLGQDLSDSERLGVGAVVGDEIWDQQSRARIQLGPLSLEQYLDFLPGGEGHRQVRALAGFFAGGEIDLELQLVLKREDVPAFELKQQGEQEPQLGWTSWIKSVEFTRDPGETILEL
ncbi:MAG TPA: type VI secretion system baseplate subunit TssG [Candidatus Sulfopaludibacter sp.]|nr:type VI secretion system baseplate subunit TssG [Candidatus Sulfopaludibacter sp.]